MVNDFASNSFRTITLSEWSDKEAILVELRKLVSMNCRSKVYAIIHLGIGGWLMVRPLATRSKGPELTFRDFCLRHKQTAQSVH